MFDPGALRMPYLLFVGDAADGLDGKTAAGIAHWRPENCAGQLRLPGAGLDTGFPDMTVAEAASAGVGTLVIGTAPVGGALPEAWVEYCVAALAAGIDVAGGLHARLGAIPVLAQAAARAGARVIDVRDPPPGLPCGTGRRRAGRRLLSVGTDCCVGKMYSTLAIHREMAARGMNATFRATGQTGILIAGAGVPIDAVVADFVSGAAEQLAPANAPGHWDVIEGQGSLFHPAYAAVSLGLLHGAQADALVLCHELGRERIDGDYPDYPIPDLAEVLALNLTLARRTNPGCRLVGLSVNSSRLDADRAGAEMAALSQRFGVPVVDPVRTGAAAIVDHLEGETWQ